MADQAKISDKSYFGFQTSGLGYGVTPDKQFPDVSYVPSAAGPVRAIGTVGEEFPTAVQHGTVDSDIVMSGEAIDFVSVCYALEAMFGTVSPTTVGVTGKQRVYTPGTTQPRYFSNDFGDSVRFQRAIDCFLNSLHFHATLNETVFDGAGKGQLIRDSVQDGLTLAGSPTVTAQKTPDPLKSDLIIAASLSGLDSGAALGRGFVWDLNLADRWGVIHPMNSALAGAYDAVIRKKPGTADGQIQLGADADGWAWLTRVSGNTIAYLRYSVFGDQIAAGTAEVQTVTMTGTSGTWVLGILGKSLTGLAWNISAAALQALINALVVRGAKDVTVSLTTGVYTITFPTYLGNVAQVTTDSTGLTGGTATPATGTPGVAPVNYLFQADMAVAASGWPKRADMEGLDVLDIPLWMMKTATLNGCQFTVINEAATL